MPSARDHNPHRRRLHLPIVGVTGGSTAGSTAASPAGATVPSTVAGGPAPVEDTHVAHSVGCAQTTRPARRPEWLKVKAQTGPNYSDLKRIMRSQSLHTVCEEAGCPNIYECWADGTATFMILGERCTRACGFCLVDTRHPVAPAPDEPARVADAIESMGLEHAVLTMVARDDLDDGGMGHVAACVVAIRDRRRANRCACPRA